MHVVNMHEAKTHLSRLVQEAVDGGEVVISRGNTPLVKLVPLTQTRPKRVLGTAKGLVSMAADFDEPLSELDGYR
jgi:prevent-host-death family protein